MKTFQNLLATFLLVAVLASQAAADGTIYCGVVGTPPPPPTAQSTQSFEQDETQSMTASPSGAEASTGTLIESAITVLQSVLSLF